MPFNNVISRSDAAALIPEEVSGEIIGSLIQQSAALTRFPRVPMSRAQLRMPIIAALPIAYFVAGDTGLKQTTEAGWANKFLNAEELAAIVPIPESVLDDTAFDVWALVRPLIVEALGRTIDAAIFFGVNKPASWPTAIVPAAEAAGNVATKGLAPAEGGIAGDLSAAFATVEADGYDVNGIIAHRLLKAALRDARSTTGEQLTDQPSPSVGTQPVDSIYGVGITYPMRGLWPTGAGAAEAIVGDFTEGILGMRQDMTWKVLDQAVLQDGTGAIQFNLAQQDMVALRVVMRVAWEVKGTVTHDQTDPAQRYPFGVLKAA